MKNISKIILSVGLVFMASCMSDDDTDLQGPKPVVSNAGATSFSFVEGDGNTFTIDLNISQAIAEPILLAMIPSDPSGVIQASDYELVDNVTDFSQFFASPNFFTGMTTEDVHTGGHAGKVVIIPPYTTSYSFEITAADDLLSEALLENGSIELVTYASRTGLASGDKIVYDLTIENVDKLQMDFAWDSGDIDLSWLTGTPDDFYAICDFSDVDVYMATAAGFDINNPWANEIGLYDAATGACPERIVIREGQLADGDYILFTDLWDNQFAGIGLTNTFAINATFTKEGVFEETVVQDASQAYDADTPAGAFNGVVAKLNIAGNIFTVTDYNDVAVASGRLANAKTPSARPARIVANKK